MYTICIYHMHSPPIGYDFPRKIGQDLSRSLYIVYIWYTYNWPPKCDAAGTRPAISSRVIKAIRSMAAAPMPSYYWSFTGTAAAVIPPPLVWPQGKGYSFSGYVSSADDLLTVFENGSTLPLNLFFFFSSSRICFFFTNIFGICQWEQKW